MTDSYASTTVANTDQYRPKPHAPTSFSQPVEPLQNFYNFFNTIKDFLFILDLDGNILYFNKTVEDRLGYTHAELDGQSVLTVHPIARRLEAHQYVVEMLKNEREFCPIPLVTKDGQQIPVETRVTLGSWSGQDVLFGVSKDITDLKLSEEKFSKAFHNSGSIMAISKISDGRFIDVNQTFCETLGYTREEVIGHTSVELGMFIHDQNRVDTIRQLDEHSKFRNVEVEVRGKDDKRLIGLFNGDYIYIGQEKYLLTNMIDITEIKKLEQEIRAYNMHLEQLVENKVAEIRKAEQKILENEQSKQDELRFAYLHDKLTGLMNRNALRTLTNNLDNVSLIERLNSVLLINLDNFHIVNDVLGVSAGDRIIFDISQKIQEVTQNVGSVYRNEGDEFIILVDSIDPVAINKLAKRLLLAISEKVMISNRLFLITASIGIGLGRPEQTITQTIKNADTALYIAKKRKNTFVTFSAEMDKSRLRATELEEDLRLALDENQLELYFQPIFNLRTQKFDQAEALLRWNHPVYGQISPGEFIPIAETTKLILPITDWVIREACTKIAEWDSLKIEGVGIGVNLSFISFENRGDELVLYIAKMLQETGINPGKLKLEITESTLIHDTAEVIRTFRNLKKLGVNLVLDDFGTGYSTFGYLKDLPLDIVKIDRSLITNLESVKKEQMILESLITIIHGLELEVVVEGVEREAQLGLLLKNDCDYMQGFYFSKPLPAAEFVNFIVDTMN